MYYITQTNIFYPSVYERKFLNEDLVFLNASISLMSVLNNFNKKA